MARKRAAAKQSKAKPAPAVLLAAADGAAIQLRNKTIFLGHSTDLTGDTVWPASDWRVLRHPRSLIHRRWREKEA